MINRRGSGSFVKRVAKIKPGSSSRPCCSSLQPRSSARAASGLHSSSSLMSTSGSQFFDANTLHSHWPNCLSNRLPTSAHLSVSIPGLTSREEEVKSCCTNHIAHTNRITNNCPHAENSSSSSSSSLSSALHDGSTHVRSSKSKARSDGGNSDGYYDVLKKVLASIEELQTHKQSKQGNQIGKTGKTNLNDLNKLVQLLQPLHVDANTPLGSHTQFHSNSSLNNNNSNHNSNRNHNHIDPNDPHSTHVRLMNLSSLTSSINSRIPHLLYSATSCLPVPSKSMLTHDVKLRLFPDSQRFYEIEEEREADIERIRRNREKDDCKESDNGNGRDGNNNNNNNNRKKRDESEKDVKREKRVERKLHLKIPLPNISSTPFLFYDNSHYSNNKNSYENDNSNNWLNKWVYKWWFNSSKGLFKFRLPWVGRSSNSNTNFPQSSRHQAGKSQNNNGNDNGDPQQLYLSIPIPSIITGKFAFSNSLKALRFLVTVLLVSRDTKIHVVSSHYEGFDGEVFGRSSGGGGIGGIGGMSDGMGNGINGMNSCCVERLKVNGDDNLCYIPQRSTTENHNSNPGFGPTRPNSDSRSSFISDSNNGNSTDSTLINNSTLSLDSCTPSNKSSTFNMSSPSLSHHHHLAKVPKKYVIKWRTCGPEYCNCLANNNNNSTKPQSTSSPAPDPDPISSLSSPSSPLHSQPSHLTGIFEFEFNHDCTQLAIMTIQDIEHVKDLQEVDNIETAFNF